MGYYPPLDTLPLGYRFRHSHGGTGCGSAQDSNYFEQVATIRLCFLIIDSLPYLV
jgi:hypothetical protein